MALEMHPWNQWYDEEKTILLTTIPETFTWHEFNEVGMNVWQLFSTVTHPVVHLADYTRVKRLPSGAFAQLKRIALLLQHRNFERYAVFGLNGYLLKTMSDMFDSIYGKLIVTDTKEEALAAIEKLRASEV